MPDHDPKFMRAFVTGGTGFIGSNLVAGLAAHGITARVLQRRGSSVTALAGLEHEVALGAMYSTVRSRLPRP